MVAVQTKTNAGFIQPLKESSKDVPGEIVLGGFVTLWPFMIFWSQVTLWDFYACLWSAW